MNTKEFFAALDFIEKDKGIPRAVIIEAFEHALISAYRKNYNEAADVAVKISETEGDIRIFTRKTVVEEVENDAVEISLEEAQKSNPNYQIDDVLEYEVAPENFGRIATQTAKQVVRQRLRTAERDQLIADFQDREGELITGIVTKTDYKNAYIDLGKVEGVLSLREVNNPDEVKIGERLKVYIIRVDARNKMPTVMVTRRDPNLIKKLFEFEVPEVYDGTIKILSVARDVGERAKVCVISEDENVEAVGSCIGPDGQRIKNIAEELGEKVDIIPFSEDPEIFVANALRPATVESVTVNENEKIARAIVSSDQLSLAIGKRGQNVRLAAQLTGWKIDIKIDEEAEARREEEKAQEAAAEEGRLANKLDELANMLG